MIEVQPRIGPAQLLPERIRRAEPNDIPALAELVDASIREQGGGRYTQRQVVSILLFMAQIDPRLITDGTYFVAEAGGRVVGGAGWTRRRLPYGVVRHEHAAAAELWHATNKHAAQIRAVYVHPRWTRLGIGRRLLSMCERAARHAGSGELALLASLGGVPFYRACGYREDGYFDFVLPDATIVPGVPMSKRLT